VNEHSGKTFFLDEPSGSGKTYVYNTIAAKLQSEGKIVICVASSAVVALLLDGGQTIHSIFVLPIEINEDSICANDKTSNCEDLLRETSLIIWDEVPMQHRHCQKAIDRTLRDLCTNDVTFGGMTIVFGGDFRQILPVIVKGSREKIVGASLRRSMLWSRMQILRLKQNRVASV